MEIVDLPGEAEDELEQRLDVMFDPLGSEISGPPVLPIS